VGTSGTGEEVHPAMRRLSRPLLALLLATPASAGASVGELPAAFDHWELGLLLLTSLVLYKRWSVARLAPPAPPS